MLLASIYNVHVAALRWARDTSVCRMDRRLAVTIQQGSIAGVISYSPARRRALLVSWHHLHMGLHHHLANAPTFTIAARAF